MITATEYMTEKSIKPSVQRIAIMDFLLNNRIHPTAEEIYIALSPSIPTLSLTTVYNTMKLFVQHNAVQSLVIDEKNIRFDVDTSIHAHFQCLKCNKIFDVSSDDAKIYNKERINDMKVVETHIYYKGFCKQCECDNECGNIV